MADSARTGGKISHALTAARVEKIKEPGRYFDGRNGLFLLVERTGAKRWKQRLTVRRRRQELGLGAYPVVTLKAAREAAMQHQREVAAGLDPKASRRRERARPTFEEAARRRHDDLRAGWRTQKHADEWITSLKRYAFPRLGDQPVDALNVEDVLAALKPLWRDQNPTARRLRQRIASVFSWAVAHGWRGDNPGLTVLTLLPRQRKTAKSHKAVPYGQVADAIATVQASGVARGLRLGFEFMVLTAARTGEVRGATWDEIDLEAAVWTVPASRMKMERTHRVPLCERAIAILDEARSLGSGRGIVFPGRAGRELRPEAFLQAIKRLGIDATVHGFRSAFRTWAAERGYPREVAEAALAHQTGDATERAYQRSDLFELRRGLMDAWARFLSPRPEAESSNVITLASRRSS